MNTMSIPTKVISLYNNALKLSNNGDLSNAIDEYKKAISLHPTFLEAYNNIGELYSMMGNREEAISTYMEALKIDKNYRVLLNLGVELYHNKYFEKSLKYFKESLSLKNDFLESNYYTAMAYYNLKDFNNAEVYFKEVIKLDKKHLKTNYLLSSIYYEWKEYHKAIECLDRIYDIADNKSFIEKYYGFCYYHLGNYKKAISFLNDALKNTKGYSKFKNYLSTLTYENKMKEIGDIDSEIEKLEKSMLSIEPQFKDATKLSMLYIFKGQNEKAEKLLLSLKGKLAS